LSYIAVFPIIEFLLPGQKFISTLLSDILTILKIYMGVQSIFGLFLQLNWKETTKSEILKNITEMMNGKDL
jgi:hypothetical protein